MSDLSALVAGSGSDLAYREHEALLKCLKALRKAALCPTLVVMYDPDEPEKDLRCVVREALAAYDRLGLKI